MSTFKGDFSLFMSNLFSCLRLRGVYRLQESVAADAGMGVWRGIHIDWKWFNISVIQLDPILGSYRKIRNLCLYEMILVFKFIYRIRESIKSLTGKALCLHAENDFAC